MINNNHKHQTMHLNNLELTYQNNAYHFRQLNLPYQMHTHCL
jgi:hypothetical protein